MIVGLFLNTLDSRYPQPILYHNIWYTLILLAFQLEYNSIIKKKTSLQLSLNVFLLAQVELF